MITDEMILHGELYLDAKGKAHFDCHTPGGMTFVESREGLVKFIALLQNQVDRQEECPYYNIDWSLCTGDQFTCPITVGHDHP